MRPDGQRSVGASYGSRVEQLDEAAHLENEGQPVRGPGCQFRTRGHRADHLVPVISPTTQDALQVNELDRMLHALKSRYGPFNVPDSLVIGCSKQGPQG